jgi:UDP-glucose 4-epimerase
LLADGYQVTAIDNFDDYYTGKEANTIHSTGGSRFRLVRGDIRDTALVEAAVKEAEFVLHLAAKPGVRYSMTNPIQVSEVNILGTLNVLLAASKQHVKRVVVASTSSVYGDPQYLPVDEKHPTHPKSFYGVSKLAAEEYCNCFWRELGLPVVVLRYFTVYGPRQRPDMAIRKWTESLFGGRPIVLYGDGEQTRDFTYVGDIVDGTLKTMNAEGIEGSTFNLGGGIRTRILDTVKLIAKVSGIDDYSVVHERASPADVSDTQADTTRATEILNFRPKVPLEEGIGRVVDWYRDSTRPARS